MRSKGVLCQEHHLDNFAGRTRTSQTKTKLSYEYIQISKSAVPKEGRLRSSNQTHHHRSGRDEYLTLRQRPREGTGAIPLRKSNFFEHEETGSRRVVVDPAT